MNSIIHLHTNPDLSPKHIEFNRLVASIAKLRAELVAEQEKLEVFSEFYNTKIKVLLVDYAQINIELAKKFDDFASEGTLPKTIERDLEYLVTGLLSEAFVFIFPDDGLKKIYSRWSGYSFDEALKEQQEEQIEDLEDYLRAMGVDIDFDDIDFGDPDSDEKLHERLREAREKLDQKKSEKKANKKKSAKELKAEELEILQSEIKNKSLRSVYVSLAKILHPDTESDPDLKVEKEEVMKQVTKAYEDKDIVTLLVIEANWLSTTEKRLSSISEQVATVYIQLLKEQAKKLRQEKAEARYHPRFQDVVDYVSLKKERGILILEAKKSTLSKEIRAMRKEVEMISTSSRSEIKKLIKSMAKPYHPAPKDDFFGYYDRF
jgi:hypothetical protein